MLDIFYKGDADDTLNLEHNACRNVERTIFRGNMMVCKVLETTKFPDFVRGLKFGCLFLIIFNFSDAASVESSGSDELDETKITNLQEIIKPHPNLANRMYFV